MGAAPFHPTETTTGVTRTSAKFCAALRYEELPPAVAEEGKRLILDTVARGLGGHAVEKGQMAVRFAQRMEGVPEATIVGTAHKVPAAMAAFANGDLMNALDWNTLLPPSHVPPYVVPSVLALAEGTEG